METKIGGIKFISEEKRTQLDNELVSIAKSLLDTTKALSPNMTDYNYNCLIGGIKCRLNKISDETERMRLEDIANNTGQ